jgi:formylmethanofuran dehydrogenase subunit E
VEETINPISDAGFQRVNSKEMSIRGPMQICSYTFEEYVEKVRTFHGYPAPGVIVGGFMVDLAYKYLPTHGLFDAISETSKCLPDAIQLLTPCTIGNSWLRIMDVGRFAMALYDKTTGHGVRVSVDAGKVGSWSPIKNWYFKLAPKVKEDIGVLLTAIREAGSDILNLQPVKVLLGVPEKRRRTAFGACPHCNETYPIADGPACRACQGRLTYIGQVIRPEDTTKGLPYEIERA